MIFVYRQLQKTGDSWFLTGDLAGYCDCESPDQAAQLAGLETYQFDVRYGTVHLPRPGSSRAYLITAPELVTGHLPCVG